VGVLVVRKTYGRTFIVRGLSYTFACVELENHTIDNVLEWLERALVPFKKFRECT